MFKNPGKKIKMLAQIWFFLVLVASVVLAFVLGMDRGKLLPELFFPILFGGPFFGYLSGLFVYGFGEHIDNTAEINEKINKCGFQKNGTKTPAATNSAAASSVKDELPDL